MAEHLTGADAAAQPLIGAALPRREDRRFLTGQGRFTDDVQAAGARHCVFVRSPHPHARLLGIDTAPALALPGVQAVLTSRDLEAAGVGPISSMTRTPPFEVRNRDGELAPDLAQYPLARGRVRYVGEPVACVVADDLATARDAAEQVQVDYEPLDAVVSYAEGQRPNAPCLFDELPSNASLDWRLGDAAAVEVAFAAAAHVVEGTFTNNRVAIAFMEPRAAVADYDPDTQRYRLTAGSQGAHGIRAALCGVFGIEPRQLRVVTPDTGGGFGARSVCYPEFVALLVAARRLQCPVRWAAERAESFLSDVQARDHELYGALALDADGRFLGLRVRVLWRHGAYVMPRNMLVMIGFLPPTLGGVYTISCLDLEMRGFASNTTPQGAYRGIGRIEANYLMESLIDAAAGVTGIDPVTLRQRNLVDQQAMPWTAPGGAVYRSGAFAANLSRALELAQWPTFAARRAAARAGGRLRGIGVGMFIENDGGAPTEFAELVARPDGSVRVNAGTQDFGMGHTTVFSQVVADLLGVPYASVEVLEGDTDEVAAGSGSHGSRSARIGGAAVVRGAEALIENGRQRAADMLEAAASDIEYSGGSFRVAGTDRLVTLTEVAAYADTHGERVSGAHTFETRGDAHSNGVQICELDVDPETGRIEILRHLVLADVGRILNPLIVAGQMHGGLAQGLGQALLEQVVYDPDTGQTLTGSFMDYAIPRADDLPSFDVATNELWEPDNPLGVKGAGEGPTTGAPAAFMNALRDALGQPAAARLQMPATPERVWRALHGR